MIDHDDEITQRRYDGRLCAWEAICDALLVLGLVAAVKWMFSL